MWETDLRTLIRGRCVCDAVESEAEQEGAVCGGVWRLHVGCVREAGEGPFKVGEARVPTAQGGGMVVQFPEDEGWCVMVSHVKL